MREFATGATRDSDKDKLDFEGFLSPLVLERFAQYMHKHRLQPDGTLRDSDNWQQGIPLDVYMKSGWRHFFDWWKEHRGLEGRDDVEEAVCALLFNAMGYLHEHLQTKRNKPIDRGADKISITSRIYNEKHYFPPFKWGIGDNQNQ